MRRLATRARRTEDDIQADVRTILLYGGLNLGESDLLEVTLEAQAGGGHRIDIEAGYCVIEVKRDDIWRSPLRDQWIEQLAGYMRQRSAVSEQRYVGILTDGVSWVLYHLATADQITEVSRFALQSDNPDASALSIWLEGVLATAQDVVPTPIEIRRRLGAGTPTHELEHAEIQVLWNICRDHPSAQLKRELWGKLLTVALGENFEDTDDLFVRHTYLVVLADLIAHAAIGFPIAAGGTNVASLLAGHQFTSRGIHGVVESDFFDWVLEAPDGIKLIRSIARRVARFRWTNVDHDVLKVLYESVIEADLRHKLGEYYTPDWLADAMVTRTVTRPLEQRVLDPGCGSGTFLFHAVRRYLIEADAAGVSTTDAILGVTTSVFGVDVHPVAVTLARVTYLLALGSERLRHRAAGLSLTIPVYLGDSVQWRQEESLLSHGLLEVPIADEGAMFGSHLVFPERLLQNPGRFDAMVDELADKASNRTRGAAVPSLAAVFARYAVAPEEQTVVSQTFAELCRLHDQDRNHIWGYYVRHASRPFWLSQGANKVDVLVGNPPWLAKRFMTPQMQDRFKKLARERGLWMGGSFAPQQDLSALFIARCVELYLKTQGHFGFVMPRAVLESESHETFRRGVFATTRSQAGVAYGVPWDLLDVRSEPAFFPMPAAVVFGTLVDAAQPVPLGEHVERWAGELPSGNLGLQAAMQHLSISDAVVTHRGAAPPSPYEPRFFNGATLFPRLLVLVEEDPTEDPLGFGVGVKAIRSSRSNQEHEPWKSLPSMTGSVEEGFVHSVYAGVVILPFRLLPAALAVVPWYGGALMEADGEEMALFPHLSDWWNRAEEVWRANRRSENMTLLQNIDFRRKLTSQFPIAPERVVYTMAGSNLTATRLTDQSGIVEQSLVWMAAQDAMEARYLSAVFNSGAFMELVARYQTVGQFGRRHFTKHVFNVPFPLFSRSVELHMDLVRTAERAEEVARETALPERVTFAKGRRLISLKNSSDLGS